MHLHNVSDSIFIQPPVLYHFSSARHNRINKTIKASGVTIGVNGLIWKWEYLFLKKHPSALLMYMLFL